MSGTEQNARVIDDILLVSDGNGGTRNATMGEVHAEIQRLLGMLESVRATMQALHSDAASDMSDAEYARLWNATLKMLDDAMKEPRE